MNKIKRVKETKEVLVVFVPDFYPPAWSDFSVSYYGIFAGEKELKEHLKQKEDIDVEFKESQESILNKPKEQVTAIVDTSDNGLFGYILKDFLNY